MQEPIEYRGGERGVAEALAPVVDDAIGRYYAATAQRVPAMEDRLQLVGGLGRDFSAKEEIVEHQQVGIDERFHQLLLADGFRGGEREIVEQFVGFDVGDVESFAHGRVRDGLRNVALAGAGLANQDRVAAFCDKFQRVELEAGPFRYLGIVRPVELGQRRAFRQPGPLQAFVE